MMEQHPLIVELQRRLSMAERELRAAQEQAVQAGHRAQIAEKSARDAWAFAKTVMQRRLLRRLDTDTRARAG